MSAAFARSPASIALLAAFAVAITGCFQNSYDVQCAAEGGAIELAWTPDPQATGYRVYRVVAGGEIAPIGESASPAYTDASVEPGTEYHYVIRPVRADGEDFQGTGQCSAVAAAGNPAAIADLVCRPKDGKVDLAWSAVPDAVSYRVLRSGSGGGQQQIGEIVAPAFADFALVNGATYEYEVVAVDASGSSSAPSNRVACTPAPRAGGDPPPVVAQPACRAKNDKVDVSWEPVAGAAFYRVARATPGETPSVVGEVVGSVFADFGLPANVAQEYAVIAVSASGAQAETSQPCSVTPGGRGDGEPNLPPAFLSAPLTSGLEDHFYYYTASARDPEGEAVTLSLVVAPGGMSIVPETGFVSWTPVAAQVGAQAVEIRAEDARGAWSSQAFVVDVAAFDRPPRITSIPVREGRAGEAYAYDVEAWDPAGDTLVFGFAAPAASGMTIDPATGVISWTPTPEDAGAREVAVRVSDPAGNFDTQTWQIGIASDPIVLTAPSGAFTVRVGETLELVAQSNYARARYLAKPLPANATFAGDRFRFTPTAAQVGRFEVGFYALFAKMKALNPVTIEVVRDNLPPVFGPVGDATVREGASLRLPVSASDPDGDPVIVRAPGLAIENAHFDEVNGELVFRPSFEQAGRYDVVFEASDGSAVAQRGVAITVEDASPPVDALALTVDPPQSPTFVPRQTLRGSVTGEVASTQPPPQALVTGMTPTNVAQGRGEEIVLTGLRTAFEPGATQVTFGAGITVESVEVLSPTSLRARIAVAANADLGVRAVRVQQGGEEIPSVVAFRVERGSSEVRGRLVDSFTGQPLVGARVTLNGTQISTQTDADGYFVLVGAPPGDGSLVIATPNYEVVRADVAVVANQAVDLGEAIGVSALARAATPPGSLPRAATVASVLDRGLASKDGGLSQEDAEALVLDTYLSLQTRDVGVVDESGAQLNPQADGNGIVSLTPEAVTDLARRWREGHVKDLGEAIETVTAPFAILMRNAPSLDAVIGVLQEATDAAWANPSAPESILPILLFNEGTTLSQLPPILTAATSLNAVQEHLFILSYVVAHYGAFNFVLDRLIEEAGLDPGAFAAPLAAIPLERSATGEKFASRFAGFWARIGDAAAHAANVVGESLVKPANAQSGGGGQSGPNQAQQPDSTFGTDFWSKLGTIANIAWATVPNAAVAALFAVGAAALFAIATGGTFGLLAAGTVFATALFSGILVAFLGKMWAVTTAPDTRVAMTPESPRIEAFVIPDAEGTRKVAIVFERSPSDLAAEENSAQRFLPYVPVFSEVADLVGPGINPQFLEFEYHLWRYPTLEATGIDQGTFVSDLSLPVPDDPEKRQFLVRADSVPEGRSFFRVVAVQYYDSFWTRSVFSEGQREVYDKKVIYQEFGLEIPNGLAAGEKDALAIVGTASSESIEARVAEAQERLLDVRSEYDAKTGPVTYEIVRQQGRLRELAVQLDDAQQKLEDLKRSFPEAHKARMRQHVDLVVELDQHIRSSVQARLSPAAIGLEIRNPFTALAGRLRANLGESLFNELVPQLERYAIAEADLQYRAQIQLRQQSVLSRIEAAQADLRALDRIGNGQTQTLSIQLETEPLPGETTPPTRRSVEVVATRDASGALDYFVDAPPGSGIDTIADVRRVIDADLDLTRERLARYGAEMDDIARRLDADVSAIQQRVVDGPALAEFASQKAQIEAEEATVREEIKRQEAELRRLDDRRVKIDADRVAAERRVAVPQAVEALDDVHRSKSALSRVGSAALDAFGVVTDLAEAPIQVREGIRVIPSPPSAAYVVEKIGGEIRILTPGGDTPDAPPDGLTLGRITDGLIAAFTVGEAHAAPGVGGGFAPNFETDWNGSYHLAFLRTAGDAENPRNGFLVREHPFGIPDATRAAAGFPSRLIAQDSRGRIYLNNENSNAQFGGRLFRFAGDPVEREHVGVINYYSSDLGYAREAEPVAMAVSDWNDGERIVEDLFVANLDRGGYYAQGIQPTHRILRVPVHYTELPGFANGQNRHRIVGQPYAEHPDFQLTGPSDLVADRRNAVSDGVARNLYFSDEQNLFVIEPGEPGGGGVVKKLADVPGRRWSGLAVDSSGNLLFADWNAGEVFLITAAEIDAIRAGGAPLESDTDLNQRAYLIKQGLDGPTDIELDNQEARYVVSTNQGFQAFNFSIVGRLGPDATEVRLVVSDHELPVTYRADRGNVFIAGFTSEGALGKEARLKIRRIDAATGRAYWERRVIRLALFGASVLPEAL